jgi:hypothetical protein
MILKKKKESGDVVRELQGSIFTHHSAYAQGGDVPHGEP